MAVYEHVAKSGELYACGADETMLASTDFRIADFRAGWSWSCDQTYAEWRGQLTVRQQAVMTMYDFQATVSEVAFRTETLAELLEIEPERLAD